MVLVRYHHAEERDEFTRGRYCDSKMRASAAGERNFSMQGTVSGALECGMKLDGWTSTIGEVSGKFT